MFRFCTVFFLGLWQFLSSPFVLGFFVVRGATHILFILLFHFFDTPRRCQRTKKRRQNLQAGDCFCCFESNPYLNLKSLQENFLIVKVLHVDGKNYPDYFYELYGRQVPDRAQPNAHLLIYPNRYERIPTRQNLLDLPQIKLQDIAQVANINNSSKNSILSLPIKDFCHPDHWYFLARMKVNKEELLYFAAKSLHNKAYRRAPTEAA